VKLACQEGLVSGRSFSEKLDKLAEYGFEGVEVWGHDLADREKELAKALDGHDVKLSTVCAGYGGCLLDADPAVRQTAIDGIKALLDVGGRLGAVGLIVVPVFGPPRLPDVSPLRTAVELEKELLVEICKELGNHARKAKCLVLLEPLNRYEAHLLCRLEDAAAICKEVNKNSVRIMADFFHMSIEEVDIATSLKEAGSLVKHVHLADSTRLLPGYGHTDFRSGFAALKSVRFKGYMALECGNPGKEEVELPKTVEYLKSQISG